MRQEIELAKEILWRPLWGILSALWAVAANLPAVISITGNIAQLDFSQPRDVLMNSPVFAFLSVYWIPILIIWYLAAVFEGLFRKTRRYLGDEIKARVRTEEFPQNARTEPHLSLQVFNDNKLDLTQCYITLLEFKHFYNSTQTRELAEVVNPNNHKMSWGGGSPSEYVLIPRNGDHKVLNICKSTRAGLVLLFHGHEEKYAGHGRFMARILINGMLGDRPIQPLAVSFCFEYGSHLNQQRFSTLEAEEKRTIVVQVSEARGVFSFVNCPEDGMDNKQRSRIPRAKVKGLTKEAFLRVLDKVVLKVKKPGKSSVKGKKGTSG